MRNSMSDLTLENKEQWLTGVNKEGILKIMVG